MSSPLQVARRLRRTVRSARRRAAAWLRAATLQAAAAATEGCATLKTRLLRRLYPSDPVWTWARELHALRARGWAATEAEEPAAAPLTQAAAEALLGLPAPAGGTDFALPGATAPARLPPELACRVVIVTAVFGDGPRPAPAASVPPGVRALCLTDRSAVSYGWEVVRTTAPDADPLRAVGHLRIGIAEMLDVYAPAAEFSLWVDPQATPVARLDPVIARWLAPYDFAGWRLPGAPAWRRAVERALLTGVPAARATGRACEAAGTPEDLAVLDTARLWRRHGTPEMRRLAAEWLIEAKETGDFGPLALHRAVARAPASTPKPRALPDDLLLTVPAADVPRTDAQTLAAPPQIGRRPVPVAFLHDPAQANTGSTVMRSFQLADLVARHLPDLCTSVSTGDAKIRDHVVVVAKSALQRLGGAALADLRQRNLALIGDWVDAIPDPDKTAALDGLLAASLRSYAHLRETFGDTPIFLVTHHVDPRLRPTGLPPADRPRIAYAGEPANALLPSSLRRMVDVLPVSTARQDAYWIETLPRYNLHWAVRRPLPRDGYKPFLKGFTSARCGAVVLVGRDDGDAALYLGDDWPFYMRANDPAGLERDLLEAIAAFGGPDWRRAQEIMADVAERSSDARVAAEFGAMLAETTG